MENKFVYNDRVITPQGEGVITDILMETHYHSFEEQDEEGNVVKQEEEHNCYVYDIKLDDGKSTAYHEESLTKV